MILYARSSLVAVLLAFAVGACGRTETAMLRSEHGEEVPLEVLASNQIPHSWGRLASVTVDPLNEHGVLLWFEDEAGDVRMIGYDRQQRTLWKNGRIIRRSLGG